MEIAVKRHRQVAHEKTSAVGKLDAILIETDQPVCLKAFEGFSGILEVLLKIKSVSAELLPARLITPVFKDYNNGSYRVLSFFAKKARGAMASFIVKNRINRPEDIKEFNADGYRYNPDLTNSQQWVFTRKTY